MSANEHDRFSVRWVGGCGLLGVAIAAVLLGSGVWIGERNASRASLPRAFAVSSAAEDSFAVCTAAIDGLNEGFFILDFETGDLSGGVISPTNQKFVRSYRYNILKDLGFKSGKVKKPKFLMVPGVMSFNGPLATTFGNSVLYVTDVATGTTVAYGIPWNSQQAAAPGVSELVPLDIARPRGGAP